MTRVYFASVEALNDDELFARCRAQLSAGRLAKADRMRFRKDQNLSIGAGLLLKKGLQAYGLREKDMLYETGANGKEIPVLYNAAVTGGALRDPWGRPYEYMIQSFDPGTSPDRVDFKTSAALPNFFRLTDKERSE